MLVRAMAIAMFACVGAQGHAAETPRELLTLASFQDNDRAGALQRIETARAAAVAQLTRSPANYEAALIQAMAIGYRSKLTGSRSDALDARKRFEQLVRRDPNNAEAQLALGAWHMGALHRLGKMIGSAALGAKRSEGLASLNKAVGLGKGSAFFTGLAGLLRLQSDPNDGGAIQLIKLASREGAGSRLDLLLRSASRQMLLAIQRGDKRVIRQTASRLLPLGKLEQ